MRISDLSSDVCSSDLSHNGRWKVLLGLFMIHRVLSGDCGHTVSLPSSSQRQEQLDEICRKLRFRLRQCSLRQGKLALGIEDDLEALAPGFVAQPQIGRAACRERVGQSG